MQTVLIVIHLMVVLALVGVVLLQRSEGGALGVGGGSGFMTGRGQANILTRATAILAALFFATSLGLTLMAHYGKSNKSILEGVGPAGLSQPASTLPPKGQGSVLDQLRKLEEQRAGGGAGTAPTATPPAAPTPNTSSSGSRPPSAAPTEPVGTPDKPASQAPSAQKAPSSSAPPASPNQETPAPGQPTPTPK